MQNVIDERDTTDYLNESKREGLTFEYEINRVCGKYKKT
jgi:hypothetical protein